MTVMRFSLGIAVAVLAVGTAQAAGTSPEAKYQALLAAAKAGTGPVDWQALRFAYADQPSVNVMDDGLGTVRKSMMAARQTNNFPELLTDAKQIIDKDYVDGIAHLMASVAYAGLKQPADADRERAIAVGLLKSIETGDGLSPAKAFTVINVHEEYQLVAAHGRRVTRQSLINDNGHAYDALETVDESGNTAKYYFLIDRVMAAERALMEKK